MMRLDISHLTIVVEVASCVTLDEAAERLGMGQERLLAQLDQIEAVLGGPLFLIEQRHQIEPTELGRYVATSARALLDRFDAFLTPLHAPPESLEARTGKKASQSHSEQDLTAEVHRVLPRAGGWH